MLQKHTLVVLGMEKSDAKNNNNLFCTYFAAHTVPRLSNSGLSQEIEEI